MSRAHDIVHCDVSIAKFKALVKNMTEVRYVLDQENRLHVGYARNYIHSSIKYAAGVKYADDKDRVGIVHGYAYHNKENDSIEHFVYYVYDDKGRYKEDLYNWTHPKLHELEARGVSRTFNEFEFVG